MKVSIRGCKTTEVLDTVDGDTPALAATSLIVTDINCTSFSSELPQLIFLAFIINRNLEKSMITCGYFVILNKIPAQYVCNMYKFL